MILECIKNPNDIKKLKPEYYSLLAKEIRALIIASVNKNGGHLAPNLGAVELTMALHLAYDLPKDKLIFDVGHQSYTHKILTGRAQGFDRLRQKDGISGFPSISESECDCFETGHATTSISAAYGMARARDILKESYDVVAIIGDGAMTGGMAYEAMNNAASLKSNMLIVLNDNNMSIDKNIGGLSKALTQLRINNTYTGAKHGVKQLLNNLPIIGEPAEKALSRIKSSVKQLMLKGMLFENLGITYIGPIDGTDILLMKRVFEEAKQLDRCVLVHIITQKGKGLEAAMATPDKYHSVNAGFLNHNTDKASKSTYNGRRSVSYAELLSAQLIKRAKYDDRLVAVTAAMASGTGLDRFARLYPDRFFDVGIAEEHAITMASAMSACGLHPVVAIYSTFLQRAYDQLINDAGGMNLPMTLVVDRAGFVPGDGRTHQGLYDMSYLSTVPNMTVLAPKNSYEFEAMLQYAFSRRQLMAVRVPKGEAFDGLKQYSLELSGGKAELIFGSGINKPDSVLLVAVGSMVKTALRVRELLIDMEISCSLINPGFVHPIDISGISEIAMLHTLTVSMEENIEAGGFGERLLSGLNKVGFDKKFLNISAENIAYASATAGQLSISAGLDCDSISNKIINIIRGQCK